MEMKRSLKTYLAWADDEYKDVCAEVEQIRLENKKLREENRPSSKNVLEVNLRTLKRLENVLHYCRETKKFLLFLLK